MTKCIPSTINKPVAFGHSSIYAPIGVHADYLFRFRSYDDNKEMSYNMFYNVMFGNMFCIASTNVAVVV